MDRYNRRFWMKDNRKRPAALCLAAALVFGLSGLPAAAATPESAQPSAAVSTDGAAAAEENQTNEMPVFLSLLTLQPAPRTTGSFTVSGGQEGTDYLYENGVLTVRSGDLTISRQPGAQEAGRVVVAGTYTGTLTLEEAALDATLAGQSAFALEPGASVTLKLAGVNSLTAGGVQAGLSVPAGATLVITGDGSLTARGGTLGNDGGAGIGGSGEDVNFGIIALQGTGTVNATGGNRAAGIGSGGKAHSDSTVGGTVLIRSGTVEAASGQDAAAIGCGPDMTCRAVVEITGGKVTARGGKSGPGIGSGTNSTNEGTVRITGGTVTASGGSDGAGIGGGWSSGAGMVEITGGTVTAIGGSGQAAGIGGGLGNSGGSLLLKGGLVTARASAGADIGCAFSTGSDGTAVLYAETIADQSAQKDWSCLVIGQNSAWYGSRIQCPGPLTLSSGQNLTIPEKGTLVVEGNLTLNGSAALAVEGSCTVGGMTVGSTALLTVGGSGDLVSLGSFTAQGGSQVINTGSFTLLDRSANMGTFTNQGQMLVSTLIQADGSFVNAPEGVVEVDGGTFVEQTPSVVNQGTLISTNGGRFMGGNLTGYECRIFFDGNGGTPDLDNQVTEHRSLTALPGATRSGYVLEGWYTAAKGGNKITPDYVFPAGTTVYARWTAAPATPTPTPAPTTSPAPTVTPAPTASPAPAATPDPAQHTLRFAANGGFPVDAVTIGRGAIVELWPYNPTRTGYLFAGWYADEALTRPVSSVLMNGDKTVYAAWKADPTAATPAPARTTAGGKTGGKATATPAPTAAATPAPQATATPAPTQAPSPTPAASAEPEVSVPAEAEHTGLPLWPFLAGGAVVAGTAAFVLLRRRNG